MADDRRKIRVAHLIASLQIGGAENQVALLLSNLDPSRFEPHLITFKVANYGFQNILPSSVEQHCIHYRKRNSPFSLYRLYRLLKEKEIDILHCHMYHAGVKGALMGWLASVPATITSEHGKNTWKRWWHHQIERNIVSRLIAGRVAVSEDIRQNRIQKDGVPADTVIVITNAVDTNVEISDNTKVPKKLGAVGRLVDAKDYGVMLRAVKLLRDGKMDVNLQIAGEGDQRTKLERLIGELGLVGCVELVGNQNAEKFLSEIDLFVMSSKREGVPVALLEAMAHGLPIVATQAGGIPEIIEHEQDGLLCQIKDPTCLAEQIAAMINNEYMRVELGNNARKKVVREFGVESVVRRWEILYGNLLIDGIVQ